jgi:hypothetical protein
VNSNQQKVDLGDLVRDRVSKVTGIVIGRTVWLNGCTRFSIQQQGVDKNDKQFESFAVDEMQLELLTAGAVPAINRIIPLPTAHGHELRTGTEGGPSPRVTENRGAI